MMRTEALGVLYVLSLFVSLKKAACADANTATAFSFKPAGQVLLSSLLPHWVPKIMDGFRVLKMVGTVHELHDTICGEMGRLCTPRLKTYFASDLEEEVDVAMHGQEQWIQVTKSASGCGRGVAVDGRCYCPLDYFGDSCERPRNFHCEFKRIVPTECDVDPDDAYNPELDGDPPCISYSRRNGEGLSLGYKLNCSLNLLYNPPEGSANSASFKYTVQKNVLNEGNMFSLSEVPDDEVLFRPFNWDRPFSDLQFSQTKKVTKEMLSGTEAVTFSVPMEKILNASPGYSRGGRFFAEVRLLGNGDSKITRATDCWPCVARTFVEITA